MTLTPEGFQPSYLIYFQRYLSKLILFFLRINGKTRWGNEFIQSIDQTVKIENPLDSKKTLKMRTGHGRLYWRSVEAINVEPETNEFLMNIKKEEVFYDIGSNIGLYSLMAAQYKQLRTISFEMEPLNCAIQHQNIHYNNLQNFITLIPLALSDRNSIRDVFFKDISPGDALHSLDEPSPALDNKRKDLAVASSILTFSLDYLVDHFSLPQPDIIKLDVDGIELLILQGATQSLTNAKKIMVEVDKHNEADIIDYLSRQGFNHLQKYQSHNCLASNYNILFTKEEQRDL